jgi:hypothetical protein
LLGLPHMRALLGSGTRGATAVFVCVAMAGCAATTDESDMNPEEAAETQASAATGAHNDLTAQQVSRLKWAFDQICADDASREDARYSCVGNVSISTRAVVCNFTARACKITFTISVDDSSRSFSRSCTMTGIASAEAMIEKDHHYATGLLDDKVYRCFSRTLDALPR